MGKQMLQITGKHQNKRDHLHEIGEYHDKIIRNYIVNQIWRFGNMIALFSSKIKH